MSPKFTPKEAEVYDIFAKQMAKTQTNPNQSIGTAVEQLADEQLDEKRSNQIALYFEDATWTWKALNEESNKFANYFLQLGQLGLKPGETIAIMMENSPEYLFITSGINKIQGISALINNNQKRKALTHSFNISNPKWIIVDGSCLDSFIEIADKLPLKSDQILVINNTKDKSHDFIEFISELKSISISNPKTTFNSILRETAMYMFTSGTTGLPKAVIMENFKLYTQANILGLALAKLTSDDIIYSATPLYHNLGMGIAWVTTFLLGAGMVLKKRFSASRFWKDIQKYRATFAMYIGEIPRYLLNQPPSEYEKNHTLKKMVGLGLRKDIWEQFKSRFNVDHIYEFYGLTEGHRTFFNADENPGMIGRYNMAGLVLAKVDPESGEFYKNEKDYCVKCKPGDIGMALIKIEKTTIFTGYKNKEKTQNKMMHNVLRKDDTYFNTGDMLKLHEDKWVSFADRFGDTFRWKGENVSTLEIESILNSYHSILTSTVYGVEIPNTEGKAGMASITLDPAIKFEINNFSRFIVEVLPTYSIPIFIRKCDELETTSGSFKLKKFNLRKEGYNENIKDPLYFWDSHIKEYIPFIKSVHQKIMEGKIRI